ncbi:MAG: cytochrome c peroxidase [Paracoccaceae bacterium]
MDLPSPNANFPELNSAQVELGHLLFFDPILSGNKTVSCATCHHPRFNTSDGQSLGLGDGGVGLGPDRKIDPDNKPEQRIPRNSPALFNLGAPEFTSFFHDGRLEADTSRDSGIRTPLGGEMEAGFASVLSAQTMFPVLSGDEMAGHYSENDVSQAVRQGLITGPGGAWDILSRRISGVPEYKSRFEKLGVNQVHFTDISDAIAAFVDFEWRATASPFDLYLNGKAELSENASRGMTLFYGAAGCANCHSGLFQTDHKFHAIAMPQIGPGKAARFESHAQDIGRMRVTGRAEDAYRFRTPSLRNVVYTGPYGHSGSYASLEAVIRHHLDPVASLQAYDPAQAVLADVSDFDDLRVIEDASEMSSIADANELEMIQLKDSEVQDLIAFLNALTDPFSLQGRLGIPAQVPSGLSVDR